MEKQEKVTICAVGDVSFDREDAESIFAYSAPILREADIAFCQLEAVISERGSLLPGLSSARGHTVHPSVASTMRATGFDVVSFASNHCMDWGADAFLDTIESLRQNKMAVVGVGKDIAEAMKPAITERKGTRVAFLGYNSILPRGFEAGPGKPGCAPIRVYTLYEQIEYSQPGTPCRIHTFANQQDLEAMEDAIKKAKLQADIVVVSMHWGLHFIPAALAEYQKDVAYAAIDAGADLILGHHAHILKGIEVYKGKVIFYSLCNFAMCGHYALGYHESPAFQNMMKLHPGWEIDPDYPTYHYPVDSRKTILAKSIIGNKQIERVSFLPAMVNKQSQAEILTRKDKRSSEVFEYMQWLCKDQNLDTKLFFDGDEIVVST